MLKWEVWWLVLRQWGWTHGRLRAWGPKQVRLGLLATSRAGARSISKVDGCRGGDARLRWFLVPDLSWIEQLFRRDIPRRQRCPEGLWGAQQGWGPRRADRYQWALDMRACCARNSLARSSYTKSFRTQSTCAGWSQTWEPPTDDPTLEHPLHLGWRVMHYNNV